ncbi:hypothetical protein BC936DRAFT_144574 [Jimgerdemannia flammicorona]|uniref:Cyclin N-terminal domain-containing protein n=1 Tax=Jimgerdemannia flammicorona TaxID=994334 RepID=A0A433DC81_9FUNG|nr:hypothetical protein BC936DRAFT_144574 [Jimgerdemannia flammicorona]
MPTNNGSSHCYREANCAIRSRMLAITSNPDNDASHLADFAAHTLIVLWYGQNNMNAIQQYLFRNFCRYILESMQMTSNISTILLSLKYIERLRKANPNLQGAPGSEYRILVVALMLSNKFLDDNTYSLSAWVEVSGFPSHELIQCEKEYLSALDFQLYVGESEYLNWLRVLESFVARRIHPLPNKYRRHSTATLGLPSIPIHTPIPNVRGVSLQASQSLNTSKRSANQAFIDVSTTTFKKPNTQDYAYVSQQHQQLPVSPTPSMESYSYDPMSAAMAPSHSNMMPAMDTSMSMMGQLPPTPPDVQITSYDQYAAPINNSNGMDAYLAFYAKAVQQIPVSASQFAAVAFPEWNFQFPTSLI